MRFDARELAVGLMPWLGAGCQGPTGCTPSPQRPACGACTPATTNEDEKKPNASERQAQLGLLRVQLGEALSQPGAR